MSGRGRSLEERVAREILKHFEGFFASKRDGLVLLKLNREGKTILVWVKGSPITEKALRLYDKVVSKHEYDKAILFKLKKEATIYSLYPQLPVMHFLSDTTLVADLRTCGESHSTST